MVVRDARGLTGRRLCLADPVAECPGERANEQLLTRVRARFLASDRTYGMSGTICW